jgi:hypothetical protein
MMVFGGCAFGSWLGLKGEVLINEIPILYRNGQRIANSAMLNIVRCLLSVNQSEFSCDIEFASILILNFPTSKLW